MIVASCDAAIGSLSQSTQASGGNNARRGNGGFDELRVVNPLVAGSLVRPITLLGGGGKDALIGSDGATNEVLDGGEGDDFLDTRDTFAGDSAIGGNGTDSAVVDAGDTTTGVETIT